MSIHNVQEAIKKEVVLKQYYFGYDNTIIITLQSFIVVKSANVFRVHPVPFSEYDFVFLDNCKQY